VVCHTDPLLEKTPEILAIEDQFRRMVEDIPNIVGYHEFRVIAESEEKMIIAADIDMAEDVPETEYKSIRRELAARILREIPNIAYSTLYITPKYSY
jgi:divalent metal cation (Fe/Co/Zn/Cd) transporter